MTPNEDRGYRFEPIGFVRSPFEERVQAPRQAPVARDVEGRIELLPGRGYDHALEGLADWEYVWVVFVFHRNLEQGRGWKAKVQPPRAARKIGVFATRSPHRPNPIGLTAARVERVEGLVVRVRGLDLLDGTPVLDLKPYVAYADAFPTAGAGWLEVRDPIPPWRVTLDDRAKAQLEWLATHGVELHGPIEAALSLGPVPRPYRRIRPRGDALELAVKDWRVDFSVEGVAEGASKTPESAGSIVVRSVRSGHRAKELVLSEGLAVHREFTEMFSAPRRGSLSG
jgi:tRNA-Thr(GGU) m(6)t(6)A37 methyltransferase TsaA